MKFYTPILRSYLCRVTKFYSISFNSDKVMPHLARSSTEFYISLEKREKCDISATVGQIATKFHDKTQNVSLT